MTGRAAEGRDPFDPATFDPVTVADFELIAKARMAPEDYELVSSTVPGNLTIERTRAAWDAIAFRPRLLPAAARPDLRLSVLGRPLELPVLLAPCGYVTRAHPEGEEAAARAAATVGTIFTAAANPGRPIEAIAAAGPGCTWLQTYLFQDRTETERRVRVAEDAGYTGIVLTLDAAWPAKRESRARRRKTSGHGSEPNRASLPPGPDAKARVRHRVLPDPARNWADPRATWDDVEWFRGLTRLPVVAKGVLAVEDAVAAADRGLDAIIVSSHGGRLDNVVAPIEVLPEIAGAVGGRIEILLDSGVRRGADVVKALALGARAVLLGRPMFWGLADGGEPGLVKLLDILREEIEMTMMLCGRARVAGLEPDLVTRQQALSTLPARA
jgi:4-hydroxymandelate oxidase